jgi:type 1 glutamine amidotransferase
MTQAFNLAQLANNLNTSGQLDATDGLNGLVANANLASSGTPSSTTFLRGDRTWGTVTQKLLQAQQTLCNWSYAGSTSTYTEMSTNLRATITPSSSSSLILYSISGGRLSYTSPPVNCRIQVQRSINGGSSWTAVHRFVQDLRYPNGTYGFIISGQFLDSPATTGSVMYSVFASITEGTSGFESGSSTEEQTKVILMEIAG